MTSITHWRGIALKLAAAIGLTLAAIAPAQAQFFWISPDNSGTPVTGAEPDIGIPMPGANPDEQEASLIWGLRTGLNTAALQCQFEPMLRTTENYNDMLRKHQREFVDAYTTIEGYFKRTQGKQWQSAFDTYRTRLYNYFGTVQAQYTFCQTAGKLGLKALLAPKGGMSALARSHMREFRNSLIYRGDGLRQYYRPSWIPVVLPSLDAKCWDRKNELKKKCLQEYQAANAQRKTFVYG